MMTLGIKIGICIIVFSLVLTAVIIILDKIGFEGIDFSNMELGNLKTKNIDNKEIEPKTQNKTLVTVANIIWIVLGGLVYALTWAISGVLWCVTIIGIPIGKQCFKLAKLTFAPFGKEVEFTESGTKTFVNIIWLLVTGLYYAVSFAIVGVIFYITIIGIPFGKQCMKFAKLSLMPFGAKIVDKKI